MVQVCPFCRSDRMSLHLGGYLGKMYRCGNCGYVGPVVIEMSAEEYRRLLQEESSGSTG